MSRNRLFVGAVIVAVAAAVALGAAMWFRLFVPRFVTNAVNDYFADVGTVGSVEVYVWGDVVLNDIEIPAKPGRRLSGHVDVARVRLSLFYLMVGTFNERAIRDIGINGFELVIHRPVKKGGVETGEVRPGKPTASESPVSAFRAPDTTVLTAVVPKEPPADLEEEYEEKVPPPPSPEVGKTVSPDVGVFSGSEYSFDCGFSASEGEIYVQRGGDKLLLLTDVSCDGHIDGGVLSFDLIAVPADGTSFQAEGEVAVDVTTGAATYSVRGLNLSVLLSAFGRPAWLASASGLVEMWGDYAWAPGYEPRHEADGRLEDGKLDLSGKRLATELTDVDADFEVYSDRIDVPSGGRFTAVDARWWVEGTMSARYMDLKFESERMPLQNVVDMVVGGGVVRYPGEGYATIRLAGPAADPAVYVKVRR
ncbi:MAG: hypothetical protein JSW52_03465 [Candidatus Coatesbacteria bacterium]|nr:MAG: hypothetical protein JSW52_03465 [Candidatus Coatesbacteria bacterium]